MFGFLALLLSIFAASQVVQINGSWKAPADAEVRTLADRVVDLEAQLDTISVALGIPNPSGEQSKIIAVSKPEFAIDREADEALAAELREVKAKIAELERTRQELENRRQPVKPASAPVSSDDTRPQ